MSVKPMIIRGGRVVDPATGTDAPRDLLLRDGVVAAVERPGQLGKVQGATVVDAAGLVVAPGLVDIHVHLREPGQSYKETIATGTAAAAAGGFTSVCCMPNTIPVNDTPEITRWMLAPERKAVVNVFPIGAATVGSMGEELTSYDKLRDAGAVGVSDDGKPILGDDIMHQTLIAAAKTGLPVIQHAEDTRLTGGCSMNAGPVAFRLGLRGMTVEAEAAIVERDIRLIREIVKRDRHVRPHLHVAHLSTSRALEAVKQARKEGLHVTCEVAPHHFTLTDEAIGDYDTHKKMNPPLRAEIDREAMITGLLDGSIDAIATDHAPHAAHEKQVEFDRAANGITGLETALGLTLRLLHRKHGMKLDRIIHLLALGPAQVLNLHGRGALAAGAAADVVLFDPGTDWTFHASESRSRSKNTPFDGWSLPGRIALTIRNGQIVYRR
ncbi:MAG: dihydroorotase [Acidobacteriaceae bacterium]|nr:dihydroorotase [Acidobacteriaceae bacterium]